MKSTLFSSGHGLMSPVLFLFLNICFIPIDIAIMVKIAMNARNRGPKCMNEIFQKTPGPYFYAGG